MSDNVTAGEFERWMRHLDGRFDSVEAAQASADKRVTALEIDYKVDHKVNRRVTAIISAITGAAVSIVAWVVSLIWK